MAKSVSIEVRKEKESYLSRPLKLNNGCLVLFSEDKLSPSKAYIVTSFRSNKYTNLRKDKSAYCSLVDLSTGYIAFDEPSSRATTVGRLLKHLDKTGQSSESHYNKMVVKVFDASDYDIALKVDPTLEQNRGGVEYCSH